ncbi:unnamed protein product [Lepeophtheirus salmonis]|uniref:(salmon louse) hypothetical protein n=1 Tax=Lepeophtheirus salmonis TaxID=72036 RepID=A0A7R8H6P1_LEPSM|nr:unnamed protein product [Lepeophtheirus salmonis]CAF2900642.1 unnamed protein product [Lepeophtheirus salmonis]
MLRFWVERCPHDSYGNYSQPWFRRIEAQFQLYQVSEELEKYYHLLCAIDDKDLDSFDNESQDVSSATPYFDLNTKVLDEHKIATQDRMERLSQLIEAPHTHSIDEILSLARKYLSNVPDVREAIIKQILVRSLLKCRRAGLSVQFSDFNLMYFH